MRLLNRSNKIVLITGIILSCAIVSFALTYQIKTQIISVTTSATKLPTTSLVGRAYVSFQNVGSVTVYVGDLTVTADTASTGGKQLRPYGIMTRPYDDTVDLYGIVATGTCDVIVEEGK